MPRRARSARARTPPWGPLMIGVVVLVAGVAAFVAAREEESPPEVAEALRG